MAGLTRKEIQDMMREAVKEALIDNTLLKDIISECIKTSVITILKEINTQDLQITETRKTTSQSMFQEKPLVTSASKTRVTKKEPVTNGDALREMFANEFGMAPPLPGVSFGKTPPEDMVDTEEDDPRVLKAFGLL